MYTDHETIENEKDLTFAVRFVLPALLVLFVVACIWTLGYTLEFTLFEDGSFTLGRLSGCLPWGICN